MQNDPFHQHSGASAGGQNPAASGEHELSASDQPPSGFMAQAQRRSDKTSSSTPRAATPPAEGAAAAGGDAGQANGNTQSRGRRRRGSRGRGRSRRAEQETPAMEAAEDRAVEAIETVEAAEEVVAEPTPIIQPAEPESDELMVDDEPWPGGQLLRELNPPPARPVTPPPQRPHFKTPPPSAEQRAVKHVPAARPATANEPAAARQETGPDDQPSSPQAGAASDENGGPPEGRRGRSRGRRRRRRGDHREAVPAEEAAQEPAAAAKAPEQVDAPPATQRPAPVPSPTAIVKTPAKPAAPATIQPNERVMLINVAEGEECRIAVVFQKRLEELFIERASSESHVGNIYKGRITNVEPSIQAAFVDFGLAKNGFLHISDLQPQYFPEGMRQTEEVGRKTPRRDRPPIQRCLRRGQEVIVQIIKEGIGTKGPTLTSYISIPGRYLVMMPGMNRLGVSRRIEDEEVRRKMRKMMDELDLPKDMGFIMRTAGLDRTKRELQRDLMYLRRLWKTVADRVKTQRAPCVLYQESDLIIRTIRDVYSADFNRIIADSAETADKVRDFLDIAMPRHGATVDVWEGREPLFHKFGVEGELEQLHSRYVSLPSGGSLVVDSTEAMVCIDVNSGRFREHDDAEETAYRINMEAAEEIARQLRLRDLGGLILCDFIDMRFEKHIRAVERTLREALKKHKERAKCLRMSQFGIIEMTRQRMGPSIKRSVYQDCPYCRGLGLIKSQESITLHVMRLLRLAAHHPQVERVLVRVANSVASHLLNHKRQALCDLEQNAEVRISIEGDRSMGPDQYLFECMDHRGGTIRVIETPEPQQRGVGKRGRTQNGHAEDDHLELPEALEEVLD